MRSIKQNVFERVLTIGDNVLNITSDYILNFTTGGYGI
jgi:hypothetical protein